MSEISELERRITKALDRIRDGLASADGGGNRDDSAALQAQLDEERTVNAQLEERIRALKDRHAAEIAALASTNSGAEARHAELEQALDKLRQANEALRENNALLRSALAEGVADAAFINEAMQAELEALSAQQSADSAEVEAILTELRPIVQEAR
jgi:predicted  nucleic acid-binding Zn-ribbon protein